MLARGAAEGGGAVSLTELHAMLQTRRVGVRGDTGAKVRVSMQDVIAEMRREPGAAAVTVESPGASPPRLPRALFTLAARRGIAVTQHCVDVEAIRNTQSALESLGVTGALESPAARARRG